MTVAEVIDLAFQNLGVIQPGETVSAAMQTAAFNALKAMYSGWGAEQLMCFDVGHSEYSLVANTPQYTFGMSGTFVTSLRPVRVIGWAGKSGNFRSGGPIMSFDALRASVNDASGMRSILPMKVAADNDFPNLNILVWPTPDTSPGTLILDYWMELVTFSSVGQSLDLPAGFEAALHWNLALELSGQYARSDKHLELVAGNAQKWKGIIAAKNADIYGVKAA